LLPRPRDADASSGTRHQGIRKDNPVSQPENRNALIINEFRANHGRSGGAFEGAPLLLLRTAGAPTERRAQARHDRQPHDPQRSSAMTSGPAYSQHQAIPADDPKRPPLDEAARRTFIARSVALAPHYRTELLLLGAQR
jgi:hypothetical protein